MTNQRNLNIELLRILACLMVVMTHVCPELIHDDASIADGALLMRTACCAGVGIFFLITGCFLDKSTVKKRWLGFLRRIALPALIFVVAVNLLEGWLYSGTGLFESILLTNPARLITRLFKGMLAFDEGQFGPPAAHLWYIFSYALIMLWLPFILPLMQGGKKKALFFLAALSLMRLLIIDINKLWPFPVQVYLPELPPVEVFYAVSGFLLYGAMQKRKSKNRMLPASLALACLLLIFLLFYMQKKLFTVLLGTGAGPSDIRLNPYYLNWLSGMGALYALGATSLALCLPEIKTQVLQGAVTRLGAASFSIYLIHYPVIFKLKTMGVQALAEGFFNAATGPGAVIYTLVYTAFIFIITLIIWLALSFLLKCFKKLLSCHAA